MLMSQHPVRIREISTTAWCFSSDYCSLDEIRYDVCVENFVSAVHRHKYSTLCREVWAAITEKSICERPVVKQDVFLIPLL